MAFSLINIGFGNMAAANRIMAIISPESAPVKRIVQESRDRGQLIDATYGRKTRAVLIMDTGQIILSAVQPETISHRLLTKDIVSAESEELDEE
ncbi:extracellular matrix/biofilm regulator RemA [Allisonella histaminiformans]|jgi:regulator of extracellular matrix RemA (YlzA/DUF370 family)|uniref:Putative regulatory protein SAMN02910343_01214 n=2 Tax=Allisonella histaminiformans TaxID=209880 RepID=A0A1G5W8M8_9FIRM|nr:DUF370 domain-containing protein [Allisonella histaminiformans]PWL46518.1 MAG: DUF370 domain-containing protein [Veillonellaceae bacterium]MCI6003395.1 DUF370 domain-containing protein [Allisonella histaminiformans]MDD6870738.1 DUF370 domain-containing protein [Allisonella histaminiformans]MDY3956676.1 DUF370 domain-containing protein [Allisonella histaminiformans]MDY4540348.1 DUF370 domain-containing protein [Allisonella histaminiformans]